MLLWLQYTQEFQRDHKNQIKILLNMQEYELTEDQSYIFHYHNYFGTVVFVSHLFCQCLSLN